MRTPLNDGLLQSDIDFAGFKPLNADLSDYELGGGGGTGLDENTVTAEDIGLVGDGVTDNTTALQDWLDAVEVAQVNSTLLVPDGVYVFSGALQDGARQNAQILLPVVAITDRQYSITIKGYHPIAFVPWFDGHVDIPQGPIFKSTLATGSGTQPSFIGGLGPSGGIGPELNFLGLTLENLIFQTVQNPQISCLNLSNQSTVELAGDVLIIAGNGISEGDIIQPTTTTSYGLILPTNNYSVLLEGNNVVAYNFYTGVRMGELAHLTNLGCYLCMNAIEFLFAHHISSIERMLDWHCRTGIKMTAAHTFQVGQYDVERQEAAHWNTRVYDVDDASNLATAEITWWTVMAHIGAENSWAVNGGANVHSRRAGTIEASPFYVGTDMRLVPISGGAKLQARNTGTDTWADVDQWTNP